MKPPFKILGERRGKMAVDYVVSILDLFSCHLRYYYKVLG